MLTLSGLGLRDDKGHKPSQLNKVKSTTLIKVDRSDGVQGELYGVADAEAAGASDKVKYPGKIPQGVRGRSTVRKGYDWNWTP